MSSSYDVVQVNEIGIEFAINNIRHLRNTAEKRKKEKEEKEKNSGVTLPLQCFKILIDKNKIIRRSSSSHHKGKAQVTKSSKQLDLGESTIRVFR